MILDDRPAIERWEDPMFGRLTDEQEANLHALALMREFAGRPTATTVTNGRMRVA